MVQRSKSPKKDEWMFDRDKKKKKKNKAPVENETGTKFDWRAEGEHAGSIKIVY